MNPSATQPAPATAPTPSAKEPTPKIQATPRIHPVVIYPFNNPTDYSDLEALYRLIARLGQDPGHYARPITVMDRKTYFSAEWNRRFLDFRGEVVARHSQLIDAWCVDTCQMWYAGLGAASEQGRAEDVYWLIPGDFNYGTPVGMDVLEKMAHLPAMLLAQRWDLGVGEISVDRQDSKELIDQYGTFALLYNWFPQEAAEIRRLTHRPRAEFFAVGHAFLQQALRTRWYPYEQTLVMLLHGVASKLRLGRVALGDISDLPLGQDSLASALQQIERTERMLKLLWRERNLQRADWMDQFVRLDAQSQAIRQSAVVILRQSLR
jgi:hypothetical protein